MAKKRRKTDAEKEEKDYKPPEFNEREFIEEEINTARAVILGALLSIPVGIAGFFATTAMGTAFGGLITAIAGIVLIKFFMPFFKVDEALFQAKHWLAVISTYFFAFLAVWILMFNPPFSDFAGPQVMQLDIEAFDGNTTANNTFYTVVNNGSLVSGQVNLTGHSDIVIHTVITDNVELVAGSVEISVGGVSSPMEQTGPNSFTHAIPASDINPPADITISAVDVNENNSTFVFTIAPA